MRNPKRIKNFLEEIGDIWEEKIPDWRFGQTMWNFIDWLYNNKKRDIFFVEEEEFIKLFKEFLSNE